MNLTEVKKSLEQQFDRELTQGSKRNIVFWYDEEVVFAYSIDAVVPLLRCFNSQTFSKYALALM